MTDPAGNSELVPLDLNVSRGEVEGLGETKLTVSLGTNRCAFCLARPQSSLNTARRAVGFSR